MTLQLDSNAIAISDDKTVQLVISHIGEQEFGSSILQVSEVIRHSHITPIPDSPAFIAGIASFHGEMALIIDLALFFSLSENRNENGKHIVVVRHGKELYGLLVDEVSQIIRIPESDIKSSPELINQINSDYITGVYAESEDRLIMVCDLEKILSEDEMMMMSSIKKTHFKENQV